MLETSGSCSAWRAGRSSSPCLSTQCRYRGWHVSCGRHIPAHLPTPKSPESSDAPGGRHGCGRCRAGTTVSSAASLHTGTCRGSAPSLNSSSQYVEAANIYTGTPGSTLEGEPIAGEDVSMFTPSPASAPRVGPPPKPRAHRRRLRPDQAQYCPSEPSRLAAAERKRKQPDRERHCDRREDQQRESIAAHPPPSNRALRSPSNANHVGIALPIVWSQSGSTSIGKSAPLTNVIPKTIALAIEVRALERDRSGRSSEDPDRGEREPGGRRASRRHPAQSASDAPRSRAERRDHEVAGWPGPPRTRAGRRSAPLQARPPDRLSAEDLERSRQLLVAEAVGDLRRRRVDDERHHDPRHGEREVRRARRRDPRRSAPRSSR